MQFYTGAPPRMRCCARLCIRRSTSVAVTVAMAVRPSELARWRAGTEDAGFIHLNAAGASPAPASCYEAMVAHLQAERTIGAYAAAPAAPDAHAAVARLLGCDRDEVALCDNAQRAWALAFSSIRLTSDDRIICFESEYAGNAVSYLQATKETGCALEVLPMRKDGIIDVAALGEALRAERSGRTVVSVQHVQTDSSIVQPAEVVGKLAKEHNAVYLLDTCQSIGALPVDVRALQCDFACGTGRKWLRGPRASLAATAHFRPLLVSSRHEIGLRRLSARSYARGACM